MRLALLCLTLVSLGARAQSVCDQHVVTAAISSGLSLSKDGERLRLHYLGPHESTVGRFWPMTASLKGRVLTVTIATASKPSSPSGAVLDALGENPGVVDLPKLAEGAWRLVIKQGKARAEWTLAVTAAGWKLEATKSAHPSLTFSALDWKWRGDADALAVKCVADGGCRDFFDAHRDARLPDGAWLDLPWLGEQTCWLQGLDAGALPAGVAPVRGWVLPPTSGGTPGAPR